MIIDLKYHIASLVAVFLALGIGILIGNNFSAVGNEIMVQQQKQMIDKLERDFDQIRDENKKVQHQISEFKNAINVHKQFEKQIVPQLVYGKLQGYNIAIIETNNYGFHEDWMNTLKAAGANITSITTVLGGFDLSDSKIREKIATKLLLTSKEEDDLTRAIAQEINVAVMTGQNLENLQFLEGLGFLKKVGNYGTPVNAVIVVGGSQDEKTVKVKNLDIPIMKYFLDHNIPVYGVEHTDVEISYMKEYQKLKVATIDNVDMVPGQVALIRAISGYPGDYGVKTTAKELLPALH
ncbi:hypothetical protein Tfer_0426 [Thermincola ferriacetica]|uniref:Copper transporter n=1 Tax=Thermincola ferriacetica TaxID=281456 RepID=A0A0L6W589_9FIRM|nr:copper transporter [Thermincola ferriacetica]KNZ70747.1 hypothetical protein Tfer_0426 [Thermincola ferriacetica]